MEDLMIHADHHKSSNMSNTTTLAEFLNQQEVNIPLPLYVVIMALIDVAGLAGNVLVILVILRKKRMQTYTNWMILNLAVSDLAVTLFCIPLDIPLLVKGKWIYGKFFCSVYYPLGSAQLFSSVFTLVNITYVRYYAICYPFKDQPSVFHAKVMIVIIRVCSFILVTPIIIVLEYDKDNQVCYEHWNEASQMYYTVTVFFIGYAIPLAAITIGYLCIVKEIVTKKNDGYAYPRDTHIVEENQMLVKLSVTVTVTFGLCVLPNHLVFLLYTFANLQTFKYHLDLLVGSHVMLFLYCALNPIIYNIYSENFRRGLQNLFRGLTSDTSPRLSLSRKDTVTSL